MKLIGRQAELDFLFNLIEKEKNASLLVYGLPGSGKSHFLQEAQRLCTPETSFLSVFQRIKSTLNCPQAFLKQILTQICQAAAFAHLKPLEILKNIGGHNFPENWLEYSQNHYLYDGLLCHLFLNSLAEKSSQKILIFIDQSELLCPEARSMLRLLSEWKQNGLFFIFTVSAEYPNIDGLQQCFGIDFFHKGAKNLQILPLADNYAPKFCELYGITDIPEGWHFMDCALLQKRIWLLEQVQNNQNIAKAVISLLTHPSGLHKKTETEQFHFCLELLQNNQLLSEIIESDGTLISFASCEYSDDLHNAEIIDLPLPSSSLDSLSSAPTKNDHELVQKLELCLANGRQMDATLWELLLFFYLKTGAFSNLGEIIALPEILPENDQYQSTLNMIKAFSPLFLAQSTHNFTNFSMPEINNFEVQSTHLIFRHLYLCCRNMNALDLFFSFCPTLKNICPQMALFFLRPVLHQKEEKISLYLENLQKIIPEYTETLLHPLQNYYHNKIGLHEITALNTEPEFAILQLLLAALEKEEHLEAMQILQTAQTQALETGQLIFLADILNNLAHHHEKLGNFEQQLTYYRKAVIVEQFS